MDKHSSIPPRLAERFLLWFVRSDLAEEVVGDLQEKFFMEAQQHSSFRAGVSYWYQVIMYFRPFALRHFRSNSIYITMYQHHIKLSYRNFIRHKSSFIINLVGLTAGLASAMLIFLWVASERSIDHFHHKDDQLYQVYLNHEESGKLRTGPDTQILLANALADEVPEVEIAMEDTPTEWFGDSFGIASTDEIIMSHGKFSGSSFFELFNFPLLSGDKNQILADKQNIALSESLARQLFSTTDVLGKSVEWHLLQFSGEATVSGVFKDTSSNSSMTFDFVLPFQVFREMMGDRAHWGNYNDYTYVRLAKNADVGALNEKIKNFVKDKVDWSNVTPFLYPYSENYLHGTFENGQPTDGGRITYVRLFTMIAIFLLLIACINFMNLTTARASRRMKEIGVKKTMGARRSSLISQYLTESVMITLIAVVLGTLVVLVALPWFNDLTGKQLTFHFSPQMAGTVLGIALLTGLLAGSYPALYLSGFRAIEILKGKLHTSFSELITRKGLVIFQFAISIVMIVCVVVVYEQLEFIQTRNLGYDSTNVLQIPVEGQTAGHLETCLTELKKLTGISEVSATSHSFVGESGYTTGIHWATKDPDSNIRFETVRSYYDLTAAMGMEIVAGRGFSRSFANEKNKVLLNETAIEIMDMEHPVGQTINMWGEDKEIIGVVRDFNYTSLHNVIEPVIFHFDTTSMQFLVIRLKSGDVRATLGEMENFFAEFNPDYAFNYSFIDQKYQALYVAEQRVSVLSRYFAGLAILISSLGLFGLATFTGERRQKEFGIRKVLGATSMQIVHLLSADFTRMICIAILIAIPISFFLTQDWLRDFAYRVSLEWYFFVIASAIALFIAWLTLSFQFFKVATINPVNSLKSE